MGLKSKRQGYERKGKPLEITEVHSDSEVRIVQDVQEPGCLDHAHMHATNPIPLLDSEICKRTAAIFRALGDTSRLQLLALLVRGEMCVTELTERLGDNLPAISQRLKLLRAERLVSTRRQGKHIFYTLADDHISRLIENGLAHGSHTDCSDCLTDCSPITATKED